MVNLFKLKRKLELKRKQNYRANRNKSVKALEKDIN